MLTNGRLGTVEMVSEYIKHEQAEEVNAISRQHFTWGRGCELNLAYSQGVTWHSRNSIRMHKTLTSRGQHFIVGFGVGYEAYEVVFPRKSQKNTRHEHFLSNAI